MHDGTSYPAFVISLNLEPNFGQSSASTEQVCYLVVLCIVSVCFEHPGQLAADCWGVGSHGYLLGIRLLQQGAPELTPLCRMHKQQLPVLGGQPVVHDHLHPLSVLPELGDKGRGGGSVG